MSNDSKHDNPVDLNPAKTRYQVTVKARLWYQRQSIDPTREWPTTSVGCFLWPFKGTLMNPTAVNDLTGDEIEDSLNHYAPAQMAHFRLGISHVPEWIRWGVQNNWICPAERYVWTDLTRITNKYEAPRGFIGHTVQLFKHTDSNFQGVSVPDIEWRLREVAEECEDIADPHHQCRTEHEWHRYIAHNARHIVKAMVDVNALRRVTRYRVTASGVQMLREKKEADRDIYTLLEHFYASGKQGVLPECALATYTVEHEETRVKEVAQSDKFLIDAWVEKRVSEGVLELVVDRVF